MSRYLVPDYEVPDYERTAQHQAIRFAHLSEADVAQVQAHVDERWELLERLERSSAS